MGAKKLRKTINICSNSLKIGTGPKGLAVNVYVAVQQESLSFVETKCHTIQFDPLISYFTVSLTL